MKKIVSIVSIVILIIIVFAGGFFYFRYASITLGTSVTMASYIKDTILEVTKGSDVSLKHNEGEQYQRIDMTQNPKVVLQEGDYIKVGADSEAVITWLDDSITRLNGGSQIHITQLDVDTTDPTNTGIAFDIFNGEVWSKAMNIVNDKATFSMKSGQNSNVIAGLRGTVLDFTVNGSTTTIRAIRHAIYLVGLDIDVSEGDEVVITAGGKNTNINGSSFIRGNLLVQVAPIPESTYASTWFVQNFNADNKYDDDTRERLLSTLKAQLKGTDDILREWKMNNAINGEEDGKEKARLLLQAATEKMQMAVLALARGNISKGRDIWTQYGDTVDRLKDVLNSLADQNFVSDIQQKLVANCNLWLKYSYLLLPEEIDISHSIEDLILNFTHDPMQQEKLQGLFDAREFFQMTDHMGEENLDQEQIVQMLKQYRALLLTMEQRTILPYECTMLTRIRDRLKIYIVDLPPVFHCNDGGGGAGGTTACADDLIRCADSSCKKTQEECTQISTCPQGKVQCPDGSCADFLRDCVLKNGCPVSTPVKCPDGKCVTLIRQCVNSNQNVSVDTNANVSVPSNENVNKVVAPACGNKICEAGETSISCPVDCSPPPYTGEVK